MVVKQGLATKNNFERKVKGVGMPLTFFDNEEKHYSKSTANMTAEETENHLKKLENTLPKKRKLQIPVDSQISGLEKAIANPKTPSQLKPSMKKRLAKLKGE